MTDTTQFKKIVANSEHLTSVWGKVVEHVQELARTEYGVEIDSDAVESIEEARIWAMGTGSLDTQRFKEQFERLPQFKETIQIRLIAAGQQQARDEALATVLTLKSPADKINAARRFGIEKGNADADGSGIDPEKTLALLMSMPPSQRLTFARKWGFTS